MFKIKLERKKQKKIKIPLRRNNNNDAINNKKLVKIFKDFN